MKHKLLLSVMTFFAISASAKITLPNLISNDMVLQQKSEARLWGKATPNATVDVASSWSKRHSTVKADASGNWLVAIPTPAASYAAQTVTITDTKDKDTKKLTGILIGEVWLASGQSNMEMPLKGFPGCCVKDGAKDAMNAHAEAPYVRMFKVELKQTATPREDCNGFWATPTFKNALEFSATAYYFATSLSNALQVPVGIVNCSYGGTRVESWTSSEVCKQYPDIPTDSVGIFNFSGWPYERPEVTYNAMFHPVRHYTYKGIIWYQGCGNVGTYNTYAERLTNMVKLWRNDLALGDIPFYQVQIAPYIYGKDENSIAGAMLREQQYMASYMIPNSDIICTNDLVLPIERYNIHPSQKRPVGLRLAFLALNRDYGYNNRENHDNGMDLAASGPRYDEKQFKIKGDTAVVGFTINNGMGICRNWGLQGFEIAGIDKQFHPANAEFHWQTNEVYLTSKDVPHPLQVRYCFKDFQIGNLIGGNELPCFPFRTDNWAPHQPNPAPVSCDKSHDPVPMKVSILGDSYSTFEDCIPDDNEPWYYYPGHMSEKFHNGKDPNNNVDSPYQTWWYQTIDALDTMAYRLGNYDGAVLEKNNSYSGSTIGYTGYVIKETGKHDDYKPRSFITRAPNLGNPDLILVCGATNDSWDGEELGNFKYSDWKEKDLYNFRPAMAKLCSDMQSLYPKARIVFIINCDLKQDIVSSIHDICKHYNMEYMDLHDIDKQDGHPSQAGMKAFCKQVIEYLSK